jgi:hypothetical protein
MLSFGIESLPDREGYVTRFLVLGFAVSLSFADFTRAQKPPLLPEKEVAALANELSGETAKRNLEAIARFHRQRGSKGFHAAAELVAALLRTYGLSDVAILQFPADGKIFYGTQRSRPAWDAEFAELWESSGSAQIKLASYEADQVVLAEDSESAEVTAELVDAGGGTKESDYAGKEVRGKLVLVSAQPGAVQDLAVGKFGAAGIISYAQNQPTAWSRENQDAIRWGHLETFSPNKSFAFMVSLKTAQGFQQSLARGEKIVLRAVVKAGQHPANYEVVSATIPGAAPKLKEEEIAFSCHLDHQRPGANDNASGCSAILEIARTLQKLVNEKQLAPPARTIRFIFPPEIEGTMALLTGTEFIAELGPVSGEGRVMPGAEKVHTPTSMPLEFPKRIKAVIHMDMVGGGPETKAVFHVTRGPMSLPSFVHDVAWAFADWLNDQSYQFAASGKAAYPMISPEGGKEPFRAEYSAFTMGSDHDVYQDSSFGIPAIYMNDWPDRFIHTNFDSAANIDPSKLKRAAFIGAASGYFLATMNDGNLPSVFRLLQLHTLRVADGISQKRAQLADQCDGGELERFEEQNVRPLVESVVRFGLDSKGNRWPMLGKIGANIANNTEGVCLRTLPAVGGSRIFRRKLAPKGPLTVFGYDYFAEHAKSAGITTPKLLSYEGLWGSGEEYAYEVLNFADGNRNAQQIRDSVSAEFGPVPIELVMEYLQALENIGLVEKVTEQHSK